MPVLLAGVLTAALLVAYAFVEPHWLRIAQVDIADPDVPPAFDGSRIVFVSDIWCP